jgi:DNA repair exonuclease SbcCD nuclease subunit
MSEVLLFSDLHCHCHKRNAERLEDCLKALNWVFETARKRGIKSILFGGDLFHDRQKIDVFTYQKTYDVLYENLIKEEFDLYVLLGNHDLWYNDKTNVSSVTPLKALPGVKIIDEPCRLKIENHYWDFIPFTHNPVNALSSLDSQQGEREYALGHIAVDGALLHNTQYSDVNIEHDGDMVRVSVNLFQKYKNVFLGHYHVEQKMNNIVEYIGSPLQLSFGEAFQKKHIIAFDVDSCKKTYIENDFSPKHLIINSEDKEKYDLENNFVKIQVDNISSTDLIALKNELSNNVKLGSLEIKQNKSKMDDHIIKDAKSILSEGSEMLEKYIEEVGSSGLSKDTLLSVGAKICSSSN